jgi:hypothetical protein
LSVIFCDIHAHSFLLQLWFRNLFWPNFLNKLEVSTTSFCFPSGMLFFLYITLWTCLHSINRLLKSAWLFILGLTSMVENPCTFFFSRNRHSFVLKSMTITGWLQFVTLLNMWFAQQIKSIISFESFRMLKLLRSRLMGYLRILCSGFIKERHFGTDVTRLLIM